MKLVGIRLPDEVIERLDKIISDKNNFHSKNEAYQKILETGIEHFEGKVKLNTDENNYVSSAIAIENRHYIRQIYKLLFDVSKSKFNTPDDEIDAAKNSAFDTANKLLNGELKWSDSNGWSCTKRDKNWQKKVEWN